MQQTQLRSRAWPQLVQQNLVVDVAGKGRQVGAFAFAVHARLGPVLADVTDEETVVIWRDPAIIRTAACDAWARAACLSRFYWNITNTCSASVYWKTANTCSASVYWKTASTCSASVYSKSAKTCSASVYWKTANICSASVYWKSANTCSASVYWKTANICSASVYWKTANACSARTYCKTTALIVPCLWRITNTFLSCACWKRLFVLSLLKNNINFCCSSFRISSTYLSSVCWKMTNIYLSVRTN